MFSPVSAAETFDSDLPNNCEGIAAVNGSSDKLFIRFRLFIVSDLVLF
jgi:hypothetical protein